MFIRHLEQIFSIDKVVPVDLFPVFWQILLQCYLSRCIFYRSHKFSCRSLLSNTTVLNTTVLNDYVLAKTIRYCGLCRYSIMHDLLLLNR